MAFHFKERAIKLALTCSRKKIIVISFLAFSLSNLNFSLSAQRPVIDSLRNVLKTEKDDTNKVNTLNALSSRQEGMGKYDTAIIYANAARVLAEKLNFKEGLAEAYSHIASLYDDRGDYTQALDYYNKTVALMKEVGKKREISSSLGNLGIVYYEQGNFVKALECDNEALKLAGEIGDKRGIMADLINIGNVYEDEGNYPKVLDYDFKALTIAKDIGDKPGIASSYGCLGNVYYESGNAEKALEYWNKALAGMQELGNNYSISRILSNMGNLYSDRGNYTRALEYDYKALRIKEVLKDKEGISSTYGNMGIVYFKMGDYSQALDYDNKALTLAAEIGDKTGIAINKLEIGAIYTMQKKYLQAQEFIYNALALSLEMNQQLYIKSAYERLATLDSATNNFKQALVDYKNFIVYRDSMQNEANTKKTVQAEMNYEFEQKQAAEKAEQDKKDAISEQDRNKQKLIRNSFIAGFGLMLVLAFFIFRGYRQKQKANIIITRQKEEVEKQKTLVEQQKVIVDEKNRDILDSITYAKRLQDAILPPMSLIKQYIPESFVLYKPKDIVAGDFYWMEVASLPSKGGFKENSSNKNTNLVSIPPLEGGEAVVFIAAADCTGHGVPGALVSVVCSNALNRTVKEFKITETGKILDKVRELVLETFEKSENNVQDGMDISLAAISYKPLASSFSVQWSGAYNSLWYIHNSELQEVIADKQPIGKTDRPILFNTHTLKLQKGDTLYLFTDGYADQFGGEKGKKFKYKQLQQLIVSNARLAMEEQKRVFENTLEEWQGNLEQVDDVLVIGIRI
jgi:tetratricopeptide (TPR) repeat protein